MAAAVALLLAVSPGLSGQSTQKPAPAQASTADSNNDSAGSYSLVTTVFEPSEKTHLLNPAPVIQIDGGTERAPGEFTGETAVPAQYTIEKFGSPWYDCVASATAASAPAPEAKPSAVKVATAAAQTGLKPVAGPAPAPVVPATSKPRGCDALDRTQLTIRDANTIGYHIVSHGGAVTLNLNVEVHDLLPVSTGSAEMPWHARDVIFVAVPKATPGYRFTSEVLVGTWNGEPVVFEVGKDLPDAAKKALDDLGVKQDLGDSVLYSFRVKEK